jgi:hypothetical protein
METHTQKDRLERCSHKSDNYCDASTDPRNGKEQWIQQYSTRMLKLWRGWQTSLGVTRSYIEQIKRDLSDSYDDPLKKNFIEATY